MRRGGSVVLLAVLAVAGLAAGIFVPGGGASPKASHATAHSKATTHVTVTATDSKFTLSRRSAPTGTVIFTVTNKGKISHDFKIAGKKTPLLSPGHSATLRVTFSKKGRYPYLSTVSGQASHGMKGVFSVVAAAAPTPTPAPAPTTTTTPYAPPTGPVGTANTTVTVDTVRRRAAAPAYRSLSDDDPVGHGHVRDHEQLRRLAAASTSRASRRARYSTHGPVGDVDGRAGPGHLPLPLRRRSDR